MLLSFLAVLGDPEMAWLMRSLSVAITTGWSGFSGLVIPAKASLAAAEVLTCGLFLMVLDCGRFGTLL